VEKVINAVRKNLLADEQFGEKLAGKLRVISTHTVDAPRGNGQMSALGLPADASRSL
jgi:hypothetical protein